MRLKAIQTNWVVKRMKALGHLITVGGYHKVVLLFNPIESQILLEDIFTVFVSFLMKPKTNFDNIIFNHFPLSCSTYAARVHMNAPCDLGAGR